MQKFTLSQKFANLLYNSVIPNELKKDILEKLSDMSQEGILRFYRVLRKERAKEDRLIVRLEVEVKKLRKQ